MELQALRVENFRCYEEATLEFDRDLLLITGSNDGGKSALLNAVQLFLESRPKVEETDFRLIDPDKDKRKKEIILTGTLRDEDEICEVRRIFYGEDEDIDDRYEVKKSVPKDDELRWLLENFNDTNELSAVEGKEKMVALGFAKEDLASTKGERYEQLQEFASRQPRKDEWKEERSPSLPGVEHYTSESLDDPVRDVEKFLKKAVEGQVRSVKSDDDSYRAVEDTIRKTGNAELERLKNVFSRYDYSEEETGLDARIDIDIIKGLSIDRLNVHQGGKPMPIRKMGAARRRKLLLALHEWQLESLQETDDPTPLVLLYDEPDTHFDYEAQRKLFGILRQLADEESVQVVVATHSLNLIDSVRIDSIAYLKQKDEGRDVACAEIERLKDWGEIHEIARELGLRNHIVLNACLLCAEGPTENVVIPRLYALDRDGRSLQSIGVEMLVEAQDGKSYSWSLCKHALKNGKQAFLLLDEDTRTAEARPINGSAIADFNEEVGQDLIAEGENLVYLGDDELEDLFDDATLVASLERYYRKQRGDGAEMPDFPAFVEDARASEKGISKFFEDEAGPDCHMDFSKPEFGRCLVETIEEDPEQYPIPDPICEAFDTLEAYVDSR